MTTETDRLDTQDEPRPGARAVGDECCLSVDWSPTANHAEPAR